MEGISKEDHEIMRRCFERIDINLDEICKGGR